MKKLTLWDVSYAFDMAVVCAISNVLVTELLGRFVDQANTLLGEMWVAVATVFIFRETREGSSLGGGIATEGEGQEGRRAVLDQGGIRPGSGRLA
ncbi:MAG: hypothetical protein JOZ17_09680 [Acetobacteraceae bacterium]|nr:hypothetical protein [Acetobacteraceae bacterium]